MRDPRLQKLASVLVNYSVGVKKGQIVRISGPPVSQPLIVALYEKVLEAGGHPAVRMVPEELNEIFLKKASDEQLKVLSAGLTLNDGPTLPAKARTLQVIPDWLWPRKPPIRARKTVPDSFIELTIREGRNRQVRRMSAAAGLPTLRLIRIAIGPYRLDGLAPGQWREEPM